MIMKRAVSILAIVAGVNAIVLTGNCSDFNINNKSEYSSCKSKLLNSINSVQVYKKPIIKNSFKGDNDQYAKTLYNNDTKKYVKKIIKNNNNIKKESKSNLDRLCENIYFNNTYNRINKSSKNEQNENEYRDGIYKRINEYRKKKNEEQAKHAHIIPMNNNDHKFIQELIRNNIIQECKNNININYENARNTISDNVHEISMHKIKFDDNRLSQKDQLNNLNNEEQIKFFGENSCSIYPSINEEQFALHYNPTTCFVLNNRHSNINDEQELGSQVMRQQSQEQFALNNSQSNSNDMQVHNNQSNINNRQEFNVQQQEQFELGGVNEHNNGNENVNFRNLLNQFNNHHGEIFAGLFGLNAHNHGNNGANTSERENRNNNKNIGSNDGYNYMKDGIMENIGKIKIRNITVARNIDICSIY